MRVVTAIEVSANAAYCWRRQYRDWTDDDKFADGTTKGQVNEALNACRHTPENISRVLNRGWAFPQCSCCGEYAYEVVEFDPSYSDKPVSICKECTSRADALLAALSEHKEPKE